MIAANPKFDENKKINKGFALLELITVIAGLSILSSIAFPIFKSIFSDFENDEVQARLNSLAEECLRTYTKKADNKDIMPSPTSINTNIIDKADDPNRNVSYTENSSNTCKYFQVNPKDSSSKTDFSMGFRIFCSKVIKLAVKDLPIQELKLS